MTGTTGSIPVAFVPQLMPKKHSEMEDVALTQKQKIRFTYTGFYVDEK